MKNMSFFSFSFFGGACMNLLYNRGDTQVVELLFVSLYNEGFFSKTMGNMFGYECQ